MNSSGLEWSVFMSWVSEGGAHVWGQRVGVCELREGGGGSGGGGDAKLCSVTVGSFSLRQLNCGKRRSMLALPFVLLVATSHPDMLSRY